MTAISKKFHENNIHNKDYNFSELIAANPALKAFSFENDYGNTTVDFSDPKARRAAYESCAVKGEVMAGASPEYQNAAFEHLATLLPKLD